jgi:hypothetical protein
MKDELRAPQVLQFLHNLESFRLDRKMTNLLQLLDMVGEDL